MSRFYVSKNMWKTKLLLNYRLSKQLTLILFYKQRFISNTKYEKTSWTIAYKTEWVYSFRLVAVVSDGASGKLQAISTKEISPHSAK